MKTCFAPLVDKNTKVLILGSFPGEASLKKEEYYGHPKNQFWLLLESMTKEQLHNRPYKEKKEKLKKQYIGLWDIYATCTRKGSLDINIKNAQHNELKELLKKYPQIELICCNGKTAAKGKKELQEQEIKVLVLPSSSPAHTMPFQEKVKAWQQIQEYL